MRLIRPVHMNVAIPAESVIRVLDAAATPSTQRLHMRDVFAEGRRYLIEPDVHGFRMATTSKSLFARGRRTSVLSALHARVEPITSSEARVTIIARLRMTAMLQGLIVPTVLTALLVPVPWPPALLVLISVIAYAAAVVGVLTGASLEANEMVHFIDKAFEDLRKFSLEQLAPFSQDIIGAQDFRTLWSEHVRTQTDDP